MPKVRFSIFFGMLCGLWVQPLQALDSFETYGLGRTPSAEDLKSWDITVMPDGTGLPLGQGTVERGAMIYAEKCAACHGVTGAEGPFETLVGTKSLASQIEEGKKPKRTIGSIWHSAPVLFDYIRRTMPFNEPGTLTADEVYSITGWLLYQNGIVKVDQVLDDKVLGKVRMPAADIFVEDPRKPWLVR